MTSHAIGVDEIMGAMASIKEMSKKNLNLLKKKQLFLNKNCIVFHFLSLCVFVSIENTDWNIPLGPLFLY